MLAQPHRDDGYAPIRDYAVVGNKRTVALVARDGSIDWFCPGGFAEPSAFAALLDCERGGSFALAPAVPFAARRRYRPQTNVLETTFETADGTVRLTDAMSLRAAHQVAFDEIVRSVESLHGAVPMRWHVAPRFGYGQRAGTCAWRAGVPTIADGRLALAVQSHGAGAVEAGGGGIGATFEARDGNVAVLALSCFDGGPIALAGRDELLARIAATEEHWREWARRCEYEGPWRAQVVRSALALDLLVDDTTSAIVAAPTAALPERIGGDRNYDYRYAWLRDANLTLEAMLRLGYGEQVHASLAWMLAATRRTHPLLRPIYRVDGRPRMPVVELALDGYRGSRPVVAGNGAQDQLQLGTYGHMLDTVFAFVRAGNALDEESATRIGELADAVCELWPRPDSGLWELSRRAHYTQSKLACWVALQRAQQLAASGAIGAASLPRWRAEQQRIGAFVRERCWSQRQRAYTREAGGEQLDAAVLLPLRGALIEGERGRLSSTVDAIRRELGAGGPLVYRCSELRGREGAFVACSFWLVEALARAGRRDEAAEAMDATVALANDVGLLAEEVDPATLAFRGNIPQALSHLALVNAAGVLQAPAGDC